ncbi:glutamine amidotransferase [Luteolibacter flavescens]|uniref:Glutamine amidotransferase n=1 Tax=Luteolibacter flavescens TaxID=1859460 RepID=A0ABT3FRX2_9BACT|nr:glutamine amidotransferase [Luteolibacter flavescens]MCW1886323.1 glutamine amidotransferase [Luteolibacter flavescens]
MSGSLTYLMPGWWPWAAAFFGATAIVAGWLFIRGEHPHLSRGLRARLWLLRVVAGALLLACLLDWRAEDTRRTAEKPLLRVVVDRSQSMAAKDAEGGKSRFDAARDILTSQIEPAWSGGAKLETGFAGERYTQGDVATATPDAPRSSLGGALREALENRSQQALGGVILLSDGSASDAAELHATARLYQDARVPVFPWVLGTQDQPDDLRITSASLRQPSPSQTALHLELGIESPGYAGKEAELTVRFGEQVLHRQQVKLAGKAQPLAIDFLSPYRGLQFYQVALSPMEREATVSNNSTRVACDVRREPIRVLYMEGSMPTETAYLREAIEADPEMEITCLHFPGDASVEALAQQALALRGKDMRIFQDSKGRPVPSVCHPTRGYPVKMEELLKYDVVIDSDIIKEAFSPEQMAQTVAFVEEFGGGFVMVGGQTSFGAGGYEKTVIDLLMPIEIANNSDPFWQQFQVSVSDAGYEHPMMRVGKTLAETKEAWTSLFPGFGGANYATRAKPGAHVLARIDLPGSQYDDLLLFAVQQIGRGRTMAFMSDTTSGWGSAFETQWPTHGDAHYYRKFWNNTVRWLAADRIARKGGQASIEVPSAMVMPGDAVEIRLAALSTADLPGLELRVREGDSEPQLLPMQWNGATRHWQGGYVPRIAGDVTIEARYKNAEGTPVTTLAGFHVQATGDEAVAVAARPDLMADLARETGGRILDEKSAGQVLGELSSRSVDVTWKRAVPVWDRWWILLPLLLAITAEWLLRRRREPAREPRLAPARG